MIDSTGREGEIVRPSMIAFLNSYTMRFRLFVLSEVKISNKLCIINQMNFQFQRFQNRWRLTVGADIIVYFVAAAAAAFTSCIYYIKLFLLLKNQCSPVRVCAVPCHAVAFFLSKHLRI